MGRPDQYVKGSGRWICPGVVHSKAAAIIAHDLLLLMLLAGPDPALRQIWQRKRARLLLSQLQQVLVCGVVGLPAHALRSCQASLLRTPTDPACQ